MSNAILSGITDNNPNVRQAAAVMAGLSEDPMLAVKVAKLLRDRFWQVREKAAWALGKLGNKSVVPELMKVLGATDAIVRKRILDTLGNVGDEEAAEKEKEENPLVVRKAAALALARLSPETLADPLIQAFDSPNENIKVAALGGLGNMKVQSAAQLVLDALKNPESKIRKAAITAAGKLRLKDAIPALMELTEDGNWAVRLETVIALNHLKAEGSFQVLCARLKDSRPEVRRVAAMAVGNTRREEAQEFLVPLLKPDQPPAVRRAAITALAGLNATDSLDLISEALTDQDEGVKGDASKAILRLVERD